jgi:hypothetical protein
MSGDLFEIDDRGAELAGDRQQYRRRLWRYWSPDRRPLLAWIMLNPSTADGELDDPTIRVCCGRARRLGYGGIEVANLFQYRATHPHELLTADDPIGPDADRAIEDVARRAEAIVAAWGGFASSSAESRSREVAELVADRLKRPLLCLGTTAAGAPLHPLRIPYSTELTTWRAPSA